MNHFYSFMGFLNIYFHFVYNVGDECLKMGVSYLFEIVLKSCFFLQKNKKQFKKGLISFNLYNKRLKIPILTTQDHMR